MLLRYLAWLALPLLALTELLAHAYHATRVPEPDVWKALLPEEVATLRQAGELVVATPYWSEPSLRYALGDQLMPLADVARPDERRYERAIEVSVTGERAAQFADWNEVSERRVGPFRLRVLQNPSPQPVLYDFVEKLGPESATASIKTRQDYKDCTWNEKAKVSNGALDFGHPTFPKERFECSGADWNFVGVTVLEDQQYRPRRCIWAQPSSGGATRVTFTDVPLGKIIRGYSALPYWIERWGKGAPIQIEVSVDGTPLAEVEHHDGEGWKFFDVPTEAMAGKRGEVSFEVKARRSSDRQLCFYAGVE